MNPKTFEVSIRWPTRLLQSFHFHVHAQDWAEALAWVERVFEGVNTTPTRELWEGRRQLPRVGNTDPVRLIDCDSFRKRRRTPSGFVVEPTDPGHFRRSSRDVASSLLKVFQELQAERGPLRASFESLTRSYAESRRASHYETLSAMSRALQRGLVWQNNLWAEYRKLEAAMPLELPQALHEDKAVALAA